MNLAVNFAFSPYNDFTYAHSTQRCSSQGKPAALTFYEHLGVQLLCSKRILIICIYTGISIVLVSRGYVRLKDPCKYKSLIYRTTRGIVELEHDLHLYTIHSAL